MTKTAQVMAKAYELAQAKLDNYKTVQKPQQSQEASCAKTNVPSSKVVTGQR